MLKFKCLLRCPKNRLLDALERERSQICKLNLWMATTAVAFFCQTPKFAKNFFFFFCFLKLRQEGAKKSNFMLTTITRKPLLLSRLRLDTRLKRQSRKQRFSLVVQKGKLEAKGSFLNLTLFLFFSVYFLKHKFGKGKPCTVTPHTMQY